MEDTIIQTYLATVRIEKISKLITTKTREKYVLTGKFGGRFDLKLQVFVI